MQKQVKLILKGLSERTGMPFSKEIHSLDEVKDCGNYTVVGYNVSTANGLPNVVGKTENCFCCEAHLSVTCCYSDDEAQSNTAYGQRLTLCDRETGHTNTYSRTISPIANNGRWSEWQMVASGNIDIVAPANDVNEKLTLLATELQTETARAQDAETEIEESINGLSDVLGYAPDITPAISNGTQGNAGNAYAVRTSAKIQGEAGKTYFIITDRPADEGCVYVYGYATYTSLDGALYEHYSRFVDYGSKSTTNYVTLQEGEVGFSFVIAQLNTTTTGAYVPLRASMFSNYKIAISVENKIDEFEGEINSLKIAIGAEESIYGRNKCKETILASMCRYRKSTTAPYQDYQMLLAPDLHHLQTVEQIEPSVVNIVNLLNGFPTINSLLILGDMCSATYEPSNLAAMMKYIKNNTTKPFYVIAGNHDVGNTTFIGACATHEQIYDTFVKPMVEAGCLTAGEYTEGIPYWYHDDATYKVRLIGLYEYDDPMDFNTTYWKPIEYDETLPNIAGSKSYAVGDKVNTYLYNSFAFQKFIYDKYSFECVKACTTGSSYYNSSQAPSYKILRGMRVIRQTQAQWFLDTLASTPANYGVIVLMHNPFSDRAASVEAKFTQTRGVEGGSVSQNLMQTDFVRNAVIAFANGEDYSENVIMKGDAAYLNTLATEPTGEDNGYAYAYTVSKDFSAKNSGVKFFGFVGGHTHKDYIWKDAIEEVYQVSPCCASSNMNQQKNNDISATTSENSLTAASYTENRIALAKIGAYVTIDGNARDYEVIIK